MGTLTLHPERRLGASAPALNVLGVLNILGLLMIATAPTASAQSVVLENDHVTIQDETNATQVDIGPQMIVEGEEIRVLGPGPDLQALLDAITDASATKPYLVRLGPGVYPLSSGLGMKPYVSVSGSGQEATFLQAGAGVVNAVAGANNMALTDMTIENTVAGVMFPAAVYNSNNVSPTMTRVTATASGGTFNYGVYNDNSSPTMTQVTATASGGTNNRGVYNVSSSPTMTQVTATASGGINNRAVYNASSSPTMTQVTATASGGTDNYGVLNSTSSYPVIKDSVVKGLNGSGVNVGIDGIYDDASGAARVYNTLVVGGIANDNPVGGGTQCHNVYSDAPAAISC